MGVLDDIEASGTAAYIFSWSAAAMGAEGEVLPLLQKVYFEDCPGCQLEKKNQLHLGIPYRNFLCICFLTACYIIPTSQTRPYLYFMIRDFHIAKIEEDIGFYAGFVGSAFMVGRLLTSVLWGSMADRYGRKPVLVISMLSIIVFNTLFGLSTSYWMALATRMLLGLCCGLLGPMQAYASEVCREEHEVMGLSIVHTSLSIGSVLGSAIGGFLARPADNFPNIFSKESLLGRFPYFLPCFCISLLAVCGLLISFWMPETLHIHGRKKKMENDKIKDLEEPSIVYDEKGNNGEKGGILASVKSFISNRPLMSTIIVYCFFSLHSMAYDEIFSLWALSSKSLGGLGFSSQEVGEVLVISGLALLVYQPVLYPCIMKYMGPITSFRVAAILSIPLLTSYPFISKLSGFGLSLVLNSVSFMMHVLSIIIITALNTLQNKTVFQHQRGAANGISVAATSFFRGIAPAGGGAILSWAQKHQNSSFLPGDHLIFFLLNVVTLIGLILSSKPFLNVSSK